MKLRHVFIGVFVLFSFAILVRPPSDNDLGWHLRYGQYIVNTRAIPIVNMYSYTFPSYSWADSYWLTQVLMYSLFRINPMFLSLGFSAAITGLIFYIYKKRRYNLWGFILTASLVLINLSYFSASIRPIGASSVFTLILMYILLYNKKAVKLLPALFFIWANMHADYVFGLGILGLYALFDIIKNKSKQAVFKNMLLGVLCFIATLINPFGTTLWLTMFKETHAYQFNTVQEWLPFIFTKPGVLDVFILATTSIILLVPLKNTLRSENKWLGVLQILTFILALRSMYFFRLFVLVSFLPAAAHWGSLFAPVEQRLADRLSTYKYARISALLGALCIVLIVLQYFFATASFYYNPQKYCEKAKLPCEALTYIKANQMQGNMINAYNWGGFLIYSLPEYKTFVDGRMTSWRENGVSIFENHNKLMHHPKENDALLKMYLSSYNIKWAILYPNYELADYLSKKLHWETVVKTDTEILLIDRN